MEVVTPTLLQQSLARARKRAQQTLWIPRVDLGLPLESYEDEGDTVNVSLGEGMDFGILSYNVSLSGSGESCGMADPRLISAGGGRRGAAHSPFRSTL